MILLNRAKGFAFASVIMHRFSLKKYAFFYVLIYALSNYGRSLLAFGYDLSQSISIQLFNTAKLFAISKSGLVNLLIRFFQQQQSPPNNFCGINFWFFFFNNMVVIVAKTLLLSLFFPSSEMKQVTFSFYIL